MFKHLALVAFALVTVNAYASNEDLNKYLTISSVVTEEETTTEKGTFVSVMEQEVAPGLTVAQLKGIPEDGTVKNPNIGEVIKTANDLIALGERIYEIVKKGKPVLNMEYAPISVLPKVGDRAADILDTEGWSMPLVRKVKMTYKNGFGAEVVSFEYSVVFAHSGSLDGKGAYITALQITPTKVNVNWGFSMNANMKLVGLQNHGTKASPVAGAIITMQYRVESPIKTIDTTDTYHVNGKGRINKL